MLKLIGVEFFKLRKRWMPYILLLVLLATILLPIVVNYINYNSAVTKYPDLKDIAAQQDGYPGSSIITIAPGSDNLYTEPSDEDREKQQLAYQIDGWKQTLVLPDAMNNIFSSVPGLGMFLVAFLAASVVGTEYGWGTLRQTLAKGTSRNNYLTSKLLATAIAVLAGVLIVVVIGFVATIITSMLVEGGIVWGSFASNFFASLGRTLLMLAVYMSIAAFFAVLLRSSAAGMAVAVAWFVGETIIMALLGGSTGWLAEIPNYLISYNASELLAMNALNLPDDINPWWQSCGILLAYTTVFITAAYYFFRRQDLTA